MTRTIVRAAFGAVALSFMAGMVSAGPIDSACSRSGRSAANSNLCGCIQQVADFTLNGSDQRRVATFFKDPDKAQSVKMSKRNGDDAFWDRYTAFSAQVEAYCTGY
jgi:hypothetical protein